MDLHLFGSLILVTFLGRHFLEFEGMKFHANKHVQKGSSFSGPTCLGWIVTQQFPWIRLGNLTIKVKGGCLVVMIGNMMGVIFGVCPVYGC